MDEIDGRRIRTAVVIAFTAVLAALAVSLFIAGARKNEQITRLQRSGIPVVVTVTGCRGLLGGSGSNAAGYSCRGSFILRDHRHVDAIPGDIDRRPGTTVHAVTVASDPGLLATTSQLSAEKASTGVFLLPSVLALVLALVVLFVLLVRRRSRPQQPRSAG